MDEHILFEKYLLSAYRFLNFRLRSEKEIRDNLKKKKASEEMIEKVLARLREQKFLNDEMFAKMWIESRSRSKPRSKFVLKMELRQKGISDDLLEKIFENAEFETKIDDYALARDLAERKIGKYRGMQRQEIYKKLGGILARRGFTWEVSKKAIDAAFSVD